jgi:putative phosphoesterase
MKIALLGDIHGNDSALEAVLKAARSAGIYRLLITGDLIGYYFSPARVLELLEGWECDIVRGNHEDMLIEAMRRPSSLEKINAVYGSGIRLALEQLTSTQLNKVCNLPHPLRLNIDGKNILLCHGAPKDVNRYIYPNATHEVIEEISSGKSDLIVMGHTHYPMLIKHKDKILVNPGSVGQPRNRLPGAQWAILDTEDCSVQFKTEKYDYCALMKECEKLHPELPYLADVLGRVN